MINLNNTCESCRRQHVQIEEKSDLPQHPYRLCYGCHKRLTTLSLRPFQWYNLAVIHAPLSYYLHDDFYDENGEASQPEEDFEILHEDRAPTLEDVKNNLGDLIDFTITQWFMKNDIIQAFKCHDSEKLLHAVKTKFYNTDNYEIKSRMLEIVADVLETSASSWVRELWEDYDDGLLTNLSCAAACCLPQDEGLTLVFEKLKDVEPKKLPMRANACLSRFRSNQVFDWMEQNVTSHHDSWGNLAAASMPNWDRMKSWLNKGRPFSLIALDAMATSGIQSGNVYRDRLIYKITQTIHDEIESVLKAYYELDKVPRVRMKLSRILEDAEKIFE